MLKKKLTNQSSSSSVDSLLDEKPIDVKLQEKKKQFEKMTIGMRMSNASASSGISSDEEGAMASLGYEAMTVTFDDLEIDRQNMKDCMSFLESGHSGPHVEKYVRTALNAWQLKPRSFLYVLKTKL